jgi:putative membrane protein
VKQAARLAFVIGLGVVIAMIVRDGASQIFALLSRASWLLLWLVPLHALPLVLDVVGWRALVLARTRIATLFWIACIREAVNRLLPVANIGGEVVGIGLLARSGVDATAAAASVVVEILMTLVSQYLYVALGLVCILHLTGDVPLAANLLLLLAASLPVIGFLIALMRFGSVFSWLRRIGARLLGAGGAGSRRVAGDELAIDAAIRDLCRAHGRLLRAVVWQLAGVVAGASETWFALRWLGHPVGPAAAVALESLTQAARNFIFLVPAGIGVQEASLVALGHVLGIGADTALALSLAKRMREILFGVPALLGWQWLEGRRSLEQVRGRLT